MRYVIGFLSFEWLRVIDFLAPLLMRLFLAPLFWVAGTQHLGLFSSPDFVVWKPSTWTNAQAHQDSLVSLHNMTLFGMDTGSLLNLLGTIELFAGVVLILGLGVRWISLLLLFVVGVWFAASLGDASLGSALQNFLMSHGYTTMLNSTTELYMAYFVMLIALFFMGGGRWVSLDWFIYRAMVQKVNPTAAYHDDPFEIDATDDYGIQQTKF
jgi:uncharacterized membrane protein YphA (DoxX/SURF4 family)